MKKLLVLLGVLVLAGVGSVMAQTQPAPSEPAAPGSPTGDQPAAPAPAPAPSSADTQPPASDSAYQQSSAAPSPAQPARSEGQPQPTIAGNAGTLPATASNAPLLMVIGAASLAAFTGLLIYRRRRPLQS